MDAFGGGCDWITDEVAVWWMGEAVDANGIMLCHEPTFGRLVEVCDGPVTSLDAV